MASIQRTIARAAAGAATGMLVLAAACVPTSQPSPAQAPVAKPGPTQQAGAAAAPPAKPSAPAAQPGAVVRVAGPYEGEAKTLTGAGATFPAVLYSKWFDEYVKLTGVKVNYQSIGSGGGIKSISDQTVDFGATDGPMTDEQLKAAKGGEVLHVPTALGAVVATYNVPGLSEPLRFTPETLAGIFLGEITRWNDTRLVADNPALASADKNVVVVHRSDGSGTTYIWVDYLSNVSPTWKQKVGVGTSVKWPVGLGGKGNEGVAGEVKQNQYSIGYVELIYALQNKLGVGLVRNKAGKWIEPKLDTVTAAAAGVADTIAPDLRASIVNTPGENVYPVSGLTWQLVYPNIPNKAKAVALTRLLWWEVHEAQRFNADLGYAPLPEGIAKKAGEKILSITTAGAEPAFPGR